MGPPVSAWERLGLSGCDGGGQAVGVSERSLVPTQVTQHTQRTQPEYLE